MFKIKSVYSVLLSVVTLCNLLFAGRIGYSFGNRIFFDQPYSESRDSEQTYDLVLPKNKTGDLGLVLYIHGGGYTQGGKGDYTEHILMHSDGDKVAGASINYRFLSESIGFEDIMDDITAALTAIKAKAADYGINLTKVLLSGESAGGHLCLLYAYSQKDVAPIKPVCVVELTGPTNLEDPFFYSEENLYARVRGNDYMRQLFSAGIKQEIDLNNFTAAQEALQKYSPVNYVDENTVPTFFGHGDSDRIVPYQNAVDLDAKLTECGVTHKLITYPNSGHSHEDETAQAEYTAAFTSCLNTYLKQ